MLQLTSSVHDVIVRVLVAHNVMFDQRVQVVLGEFIVIDFAQVADQLFNVYALLHSNVYVCVLAVNVARLVKSILPKTLHTVEVVQVLFVDVLKSTDHILGISCVIVATHAVVNVAVS